MKIGLVCPYSMAHEGGVQECVRAMQQELDRRGHEALIITPAPRGHKHKVPPDVIFIGQSKRIRTPLGTSDDIAVSINTAVIDDVLAEQNFDLIHIHEPLVPFLSRQMLPRISCPVVGTFHAALPERFLGKVIAGSIGPYVRSILKYLNSITAVAPAATSHIVDYNPGDIAIIPNGIDLKYYRPAINSANKKPAKNIFYVGRLEARKGLKYLLKAYKDLALVHPEVRLVIAGDGPDRKKLEKMAENLELKHVKFLGHVTEEEKLEQLRRAAVFCSPPTYGESFGIVLLEAMAVGVPIVAGNNPGYSAVLSGQGQVSLVDSEDVRALAERLETMLYDEKTRELWKKWSARAIKQYNYEKIVDQYEQLYKSLVAQKSLPKP